jgi:hypothetical protein
MKYENGSWYMTGVPREHPDRLKTLDALITYVNEVGFLPLFGNEIDGFSVEDRVCPSDWWTEDAERDPWEWRVGAARSGKVAYGKFFGKKAGFVSLEWLPRFVNYRRDGYDFDSRYEEGLARHREQLIMQLFASRDALPSYEIKQLAGFGKGGEKNFSGIITDLQMQTYLTIHDFRRRINKKGQPYGMAVAVYAPPETLFGETLVTSAYHEEPAESFQKIIAHLTAQFPDATEAELRALLR